MFPKANITRRDVDTLRAALPAYNVQIGSSAIDPRNPADVLFVHRELVSVEAVKEILVMLDRMGVPIKSVQQARVGGRREIQVGTITEDLSSGSGVFRDDPPLNLAEIRRLRGAAFWRAGFNGRVYCPVQIGATPECRMDEDGYPVQ